LNLCWYFWYLTVFWCWCFVGILYDLEICVGMGAGVEVGGKWPRIVVVVEIVVGVGLVGLTYHKF